MIVCVVSRSYGAHSGKHAMLHVLEIIRRHHVGIRVSSLPFRPYPMDRGVRGERTEAYDRAEVGVEASKWLRQALASTRLLYWG